MDQSTGGAIGVVLAKVLESVEYRNDVVRLKNLYVRADFHAALSTAADSAESTMAEDAAQFLADSDGLEVGHRREHDVIALVFTADVDGAVAVAGIAVEDH